MATINENKSVVSKKNHSTATPFSVLPPRAMLLGLVSVFLLSACATPQTITRPVSANPDDLLIIDCLLPGQVRQLGSRLTFLSPRRPIKTSASQCEIRGGEYVAFDRADAGTSLKIWLPQAESGDPQAQTYVGEIFEKGLGVEPDYSLAVLWYQRAADQGFTRAQINLGYLYESGLGVTQDLSEAMNLYRRASGIEDGTLEYVSSVEFARRETAKRDTEALRTQVSDLTQRLADAEARYRAVSQQVVADQAELQALKEKTEAKRQELASRYQSNDAGASPETARALVQLQTVRDRIATKQSSDNELSAQLANSRQEVARLRQGLAADNQQIQQLKTQLAEQVKVIATLQAELETAAPGQNQSETRNALVQARNTARLTLQDVSNLRRNINSVPASVVEALGQAEQRELELTAALVQRTETLATLRRQQVELESQYQQSIDSLQSQLDLSVAEQTRVAGRLADNQLSMQAIENENEQLRQRLKQQNEEVATREREQQRLSARVAQLALSERASQAEKRAAEAATRAAVAELELARFEQSRLVTRLVETQLNTRQNSPSDAEQLAILEKQLAIQQGVVDSRQQQVSLLEDSVTERQAESQSRPAEQVAQVVAIGPTIEIIEPPVLLTRGTGEITPRADGSIDLIGRITPAENLLSFAINGQRQSVNTRGVFNFQTSQAMNTIELTAVDDEGERSSVTFSVAQRSSGIPSVAAGSSATSAERYDDIDFGQYHAIIIGNNEYSGLTNLRTAANDAQRVDEILRNQYGFSTQLLINATRLDILQALTRAKENLTETDNLIVYYAGHGQLDPDGERGYWLPVDATIDNSEQWISNAVVTDFLDNIPAKQIMVVADSCFSGTLTKASIPRMQAAMPAPLRKKWLSLMAKRKVRTVLSSGGVKPVYDGTAEHSLFATAFIDQLSKNNGVLEGYQLYADVRANVQQSASSLGVDQTPQYSAAKFAGHEVGEFLLVSR